AGAVRIASDRRHAEPYGPRGAAARHFGALPSENRGSLGDLNAPVKYESPFRTVSFRESGVYRVGAARSMKVFVTGGNGFIGSAVVRRLLHAGHAVRCLLRPTSRTERIDDLPLERVRGDVRDLASVRAGMDGCDGTVHLAGLSSWSDIDSPALSDVVENGTRHVLDAASRLKAHRVVFVSSATAVNGSDTPEIFDETAAFTLDDPALKYAHAKHRAEALCLEAF